MSSSSSNADALALGIHGPLGPWLEFNRRGAFETPGGLAMVAPFPPADRMSITTGLTDPRDFASHGYDVLKALSEASPRAIDQFESILDFGVGAGRLARMFKGYRGRYTGCDVDAENIRWLSRGLTYVDARHTLPRQALPFPVSDFDLIVSISVFSHMNERDQDFYLAELARVARPQATLMLTVHGERALRRAETEPGIFKMLSIPTASVPATRGVFPAPGFNFILQQGHLTSATYEYGITFISEHYIRERWSRHFDVVEVRSGAIHDFQDIVVLSARS